MNKNDFFGNVRRVYENYHLNTFKFRKQYSQEDYKRLVDYLASVVPMEFRRREYDKVLSIIEAMPPSLFISLCALDRFDHLDILIDLIKKASK